MNDINKNFKKVEQIMKQPNSLNIVVYAKWCGHCEKLISLIRKMEKKKIKDTNDPVVIMVEEEVLTHFNDYHQEHPFTQIVASVRGFPTIMKLRQHILPNKIDLKEDDITVFFSS